ncbi:helix-turn-helix domain-containing protein [Rhodococcus sp. NPDC004095]
MRDHMTVAEVANELGVSTKTVRRRISDGSLAATRVGPRILRIRRCDVAAMCEPVAPRGRRSTRRGR